MIVGADFRRVDLLCHRGFDRARRDRIDADAERSQFDRELLCQMRQPRFAGAVGRAQRGGAHRRNRRDVHDRAAAMFAHQGRRRLGADKRPGEVDLQDAAPVFIRGVEQRREHRDAGIVDQRVEPAEVTVHRRHGIRHCARIGNIAMQRQRVVSVRKVSDRAAQQFALDVEHRHPPALGEKAFGRRQPDAARGAGDESNFLRGGGHGRVRWRAMNFPLV